MFDFKLNLILGTIFAKIKMNLEQIEGLYLGILINSLRYKNENEGKKIKVEFYNNLKLFILKTNKEIGDFNEIVRYLNKRLVQINKIDLIKIKNIIISHKGDYEQSGGIKEVLGDGNSPSVLARKHTALLIQNILLATHLSMKNFLVSLETWLAPFDCIDKSKVRKITIKEIDKIKAIFSIGCAGEAIFMVGRLLENIITEYLLLLNKSKLINLKTETIKSPTFTFENKIDFLHNKSQKIITDSQWSKMKTVKWDRNTYGHFNRIKPKDADAIIIIGLQNIEFLDQKIKNLKKHK